VVGGSQRNRQHVARQEMPNSQDLSLRGRKRERERERERERAGEVGS
jgi:hypothetical protein